MDNLWLLGAAAQRELAAALTSSDPAVRSEARQKLEMTAVLDATARVRAKAIRISGDPLPPASAGHRMKIDDLTALIALNRDPLAEMLAMEARAKAQKVQRAEGGPAAAGDMGLESKLPENPVSWIGRRVRGNR